MRMCLQKFLIKCLKIRTPLFIFSVVLLTGFLSPYKTFLNILGCGGFVTDLEKFIVGAFFKKRMVGLRPSVRSRI